MDWEIMIGGIIIPAGMYSLVVVAARTDSSIPGITGSMMMTAGIFLICRAQKKWLSQR